MRNIKYILFLWLIVSCSKEEIIDPIPEPEPPVLCEIDYTILQSGIDRTSSHFQPYNIPFVDYQSYFNPKPSLLSYSQIIFGSGDFNGDGIPDQVASTVDWTNPSSNRLSVIINGNVKWSFINPQVMTTKFLVKDLNGDNIDDIVLMGSGEDIGDSAGDEIYAVYMYTNNYEITKLPARSGYHNTGNIGNIDGGTLDVLAVDSQAFSRDPNGFVKFYSRVDNNTWIEKETNIFYHHVARMYRSELVDINNDGILDLILAGHEWEEEWMSTSLRPVEWRNHILLGLGDGTFDLDNRILLPIIPNWGIITDIDVYDIDNDGNREIIITRTTGRDGLPGMPWPGEAYDGHLFQILKGSNSDWYEWQKIEMPPNLFQYTDTEEWPYMTKIYDVNKDCLLDIVPESDRLNAKDFDRLDYVRGLYYEQQSDNTFKINYKK